MITRILLSVGLIVITVLLGFILHKAGKPYNSTLFTFHKLATIALVVIVVSLFRAYLHTNSLGSNGLLVTILALVSLAGLLTSGAFMSLDRLQDVMFLIHRISSIGFLASMAVLFYFFYSS